MDKQEINLKISKIMTEGWYIVAQETNKNYMDVWTGDKDFLMKIARDTYNFSYQHCDKKEFIEFYGDFEGFEEEEKIINETGSVVMVSMNCQNPDSYIVTPLKESKSEFEYACDSILDELGGCVFHSKEFIKKLEWSEKKDHPLFDSLSRYITQK